MVVPVSLDLLEQTRPEIRRLASDPARQARFQTWSARRAAFLADLNDPDSEAVAEGWQKDYFRGRSPDGSSAPSHRTRLRLHPFLDADGVTPATGDTGSTDSDSAGD
jgi:anti-sigma factor RsiW